MPITFPTQDDMADIVSRLEALEAGASPSTGASMPKIWMAGSGDNSELVTQLPKGAIHKVVYSIALPDLNAGDVIEAHATFEATNPYTYNMMVGRYLLLATSDSSVIGTEISEAATRNITPGMHHDHIQDFGTFLVTDAMSGMFVNFVAYCDAQAATSGHAAVVEQDYGRLFVKVYPAALVDGSV